MSKQAKLNFIKATVEHVSEIVSLVNRSYRGEASRKGWTTEADLLAGQRTDSQSIQDLIEGRKQPIGIVGLAARAGTEELDSVILLAKKESVLAVNSKPSLPEADRAAYSELVGCVNLERKKNTAYLGMLTVDPDSQNLGLGRELLGFAESWVQNNWRSEVIEMTVISSRSELISWYQRRGYHLTGEQRPFPMGDDRFGLPKVVHLDFVVLEKRIQK